VDASHTSKRRSFAAIASPSRISQECTCIPCTLLPNICTKLMYSLRMFLWRRLLDDGLQWRGRL
jgi:hypothetical protein